MREKDRGVWAAVDFVRENAKKEIEKKSEKCKEKEKATKVGAGEGGWWRIQFCVCAQIYS